jgi:hypothetical protein
MARTWCCTARRSPRLRAWSDTAGYNAASNGAVFDVGFAIGSNYSFKGISVVAPEPDSLGLLAMSR